MRGEGRSQGFGSALSGRSGKVVMGW